MKYWVCKRAPARRPAEALECLGGNGFVEDSSLPLLYRDAPLNSIWEGSGNVAALDVLRAMAKEPDGLPALIAECEFLAGGGDARLDAHIRRLRDQTKSIFAADEPQFPPAGSSRTWPSRWKARCSCDTHRPRSRTRSAPPGLAMVEDACTAPCPRGWTRRRSSIAHCPHERRRLRPMTEVLVPTRERLLGQLRS